MADPVELLLQKAMVTRLQADAGVGALVGDAIYDRVPKGALPPYVTVRVPQVIDEENTCAVMKTVVMELHCWSRKPGFVECRRIAGAVEAAIRSSLLDLDLPGVYTGDETGTTADTILLTADSGRTYRALLQYQESTRYLEDPDGLTTHAVVTFQFEAAPTA